MGVEPLVLVALVAVAFAAGFVDAIAGGGGLLQLPPLLALVGPGLAPGTNKVSSICGTSAAVVRYARHGAIRWRVVAVAGPIAFATSLVGSLGYLEMLKRHANDVLPAFAVAFLALAAYQAWTTLRRAPPREARRPRPGVGTLFVAAIAIYDGAIGPGTGMFLFWTFQTWFAMSAIDATGTTKVINWITNAAALVVFIARGAVLWPLGLSMAAGNLAGGWLGAHTAIRHGVRLIRITTAVACAGAAVYLLIKWATSQ